ncbi:LacI family transcriptional regulator [Rhodococcus triatomae]|uniref:LacI family transcriptional regulator n=1 Tax=Rhodococcus triatomae TaxID=300028 RepID=A0A1G8LA36_9NOCA|nr:LacI family DNA-binding transcriptional regulator [Rhodococcus triatomae]SDI52585.1 LacI family transcriptional regulator [Rhodococcus triatomae]
MTDRLARVPGRPPTLREIADRAGVHVSTASRVLRQPEPADGWSDAAQRVRRTAAELGYQPNLWAASLRTRRTTTLGVVMPRLTDGVVATMFQGIEETATAAGYSVLLSSPPDDLGAQRDAVDFLSGRQVDGLLLSSLHSPSEDFLASLSTRSLPMLQLNRHPDPTLPYVAGDDAQGGRLAARHLVERGYTDLAVIAGPAHATTAQERLFGFRNGLSEYGIDLPDDRVRRTGFDVAGGVAAATSLLDRPDRPRAIFAVSDTVAIGVIGVARDLGLTIPDDLGLVGYNDIPVAAQLPVPLTTIRSPARLIGATGVHLLLDLVAGRDVESAVLPVELVERASSSAARTRPR